MEAALMPEPDATFVVYGGPVAEEVDDESVALPELLSESGF
jgi:hypothetical protein